MNSQALVTSAKLDPALRNPIPAFVNAVTAYLRRTWQKERERRALSRLTDHQLRDIGISHTEIVLLKEPSPERIREALARSTPDMNLR